MIIVNGAARGGRAAHQASTHLEALRATPDVVVHATREPGHATELARTAAEEGAGAVVAVGGDGTVYEVVNGLLGAEVDAVPALGLIPAGTGNSFVRDLDLADPAAATDAIVRGATRPVDAVRLTHADGVLHYVNLLSLGFSARAGALTNRRYKPLGAAGYVLAVLQTLLRHGSYRVRYACDGAPPTDAEVCLLSFCNSRFTGGDMKMAPDAEVDDGKLDVVCVSFMPRRRFLASFPRIFAGTHTRMDEITTRRAAVVEFPEQLPLLAMIDGEIATLRLQRLEVVPGALQVLA